MRHYYKDGSGALETREISLMLNICGCLSADEDVGPVMERMMKEFDSDENGTLGLSELTSFLLQRDIRPCITLTMLDDFAHMFTEFDKARRYKLTLA